MNILITGATGLIGSHLIPALEVAGHSLWLWVRSVPKARARWPHIPAETQLVQLPTADTFDVVINLAGEPIAARHWTDSRKQMLRASRIDVTQTLCAWLASHPRSGRRLLSGSAVGIYGNAGERVCDETAPTHGTDFASQLCRDWEAAAKALPDAADQLVLLRTGLVLSDRGGLLKQLRLPFSLGLGGRLGDGSQYMPWIHHVDYVNALLLLIEQRGLTGTVNLCAPSPVTNSEFSHTLARQLRRPCLLPAPTWLLKLGLGELSELLLYGQQCQPQALTQQGFRFEFPTLSEALQNLL